MPESDPSVRPARIAVYSCYFGRHEPFNPDCLGPAGAWERLIFTDDPHLPAPGIRRICLPAPAGGGCPAEQSRLPKLKPHLFLADFDWVISIDNRAKLRRDPARLIAEIGAAHGPDAPAGRYLFRHAKRDCAYDEITACQANGYFDAAEADRLRRWLQDAGFPRHFGLFANTCMIQKMGDAATDRANEEWFDLFSTQGRRDQITLPFVLWQRRLPHRVLSFDCSAVVDWPVFSREDRQRFRRGQPLRPAPIGDVDTFPQPR